VAASVTVLVAAFGCGPKLTPEQEIEILRQQYDAELMSLSVLQDPGDPSESGEADDELGAGLDLDQPPVSTDVMLDILVSTTASEYLPGITLDLQHVDSARTEKGRQRLWVDTSQLVRGGGTQVTHVLEDIDYVAGDGFWVEVLSPIPPDHWPLYAEFPGH
jgi:hypothetical protein